MTSRLVEEESRQFLTFRERYRLRSPCSFTIRQCPNIWHDVVLESVMRGTSVPVFTDKSGQIRRQISPRTGGPGTAIEQYDDACPDLMHGRRDPLSSDS